MSVVSKSVVAILVAGWLADTLASTDPDVDAGIAAYEAENYEEALARFDAARERLGERPEISFDRGLAALRSDDAEGARTAFERASEAEDALLRGSAHYELGNLSYEAEAWEAAIASYVECLKANPEHANAKWNLELALQRKQEADEEQEKEEQENEDESEQDEDEQDDGEQDENESDEDEQEQEQDGEDEQEQDGEDEQEQDGADNEDEQPPEDEEQPGSGEQPPEEQPEGDEEQPPEDGEDGQQPPGDPGSDEPSEPPPDAEPQPIDRMDMDRALQKLDEQDPFTLDKPSGGYVQPEKDW